MFEKYRSSTRKGELYHFPEKRKTVRYLTGTRYIFVSTVAMIQAAQTVRSRYRSVILCQQQQCSGKGGGEPAGCGGEQQHRY